MIIDHDHFSRLDHGSFKAFAAAAKTLNFTTAAETAAMTQSGISQHIARLETQLGSPLFLRINKKVRLTKSGEILLQFIEEQKNQMDGLFEAIHGEAHHVSGKVRYAMPHSCLFTSHFSILLNKRRRFSKVDLEIYLGSNEMIFDRLLKQQVDFGFVTRKENNPAIRSQFFCEEEYVLVGGVNPSGKTMSLQSIGEAKFISYPGMNVLFDFWSRHHFGAEAPCFESLRITGAIESLHGAITMLKHGVGLTVMPRHCVQDFLQRKSIFEFRGPKKASVLNDIAIITLKNAQQPRRIETVLNAFWDMMKE